MLTFGWNIETTKFSVGTDGLTECIRGVKRPQDLDTIFFSNTINNRVITLARFQSMARQHNGTNYPKRSAYKMIDLSG